MRQMTKQHAANLSTWRAPRNSENAAKTTKIRNLVEIGKNTIDELLEDKTRGRRTRGGPGRRRSQAREPRDPARKPGAGTPTGKKGKRREAHNEEQKADEEQHGDLNHRDDEHEESPKGRTGPQAEEERAENREHVRNPSVPRKNNCITNVVPPSNTHSGLLHNFGLP